jgi:hypothetical protein
MPGHSSDRGYYPLYCSLLRILPFLRQCADGPRPRQATRPFFGADAERGEPLIGQWNQLIEIGKQLMVLDGTRATQYLK